MLKNLPIFLQYEGYKNLKNINVMIAFNKTNFAGSYYNKNLKKNIVPIFSDLDNINENLYYYKENECVVLDYNLKLLYV